MIHYYSASNYYKKIFGSKVYKISLDAGCTCPTRDGSKGYGGCIFCSASGSGDFAAQKNLSIEEQVESAKTLVQNKIKTTSPKFIAYFQNFTNTYGKSEDLEKKYVTALSQPNVVGLSIATRPDCLSDDILQRIAKISQNNYVSLELGLQTSNESTANFIRRGYELSVYDDAVFRIHQANPNIHVVTHVIFGLPGETQQDMISSVKHCVAQKTDGFKFTVLHVLEGTDLAKMWRDEKIKCLEESEYFEILGKALKIIPQNIVVHRLTGDGAKRILLAPLWTANKKKVLNDLKKLFTPYN